MLYAHTSITLDEHWLPGNIENARIYLASPYTSTDPAVMEWRYKKALEALHFFLKKRLTIYSPIVHSHEAGLLGGLPVAFNFWGKHCLSFLEHWATEIWTLQIPGILESVGVKAEMDYCAGMNKHFVHRAIYFPKY